MDATSAPKNGKKSIFTFVAISFPIGTGLIWRKLYERMLYLQSTILNAKQKNRKW